MSVVVKSKVSWIVLIYVASLHALPARAFASATEKKDLVSTMLAVSTVRPLSFWEKFLNYKKIESISCNRTLGSSLYEPLEDTPILCVICRDDDATKGSHEVLRCGHEFHARCINEWINSGAHLARTCPLCRTPIHRFNITQQQNIAKILRFFKENKPVACRFICFGSYVVSVVALRSIKANRMAKALLVPSLVVMGISGGVALASDHSTYTSIAAKTVLLWLLANNVGCLMEKRFR